MQECCHANVFLAQNDFVTISQFDTMKNKVWITTWEKIQTA